jgi:phosphate transport system permease protein
MIKWNSAHYLRRKFTNAVMLTLCGLATVLAVAPLLWILIYVLQEGGRFLSVQYFIELPTPVGVPGGGVLNAIVGSAIVVGTACVLSIPLALSAAMYAAAHPNTPLGVTLRFATDVLSGVPSIVVGIFAYTVIVLPQKQFSAFAGGFALAIIMTPIVLRTTEEMLKLVPRSLHEGSLALGASEWKTTLQITLPAAMNGVVTGIMLGIARVAGEAAPMIFTAFGNPFFSTALDQPIATLPHMVYVYAISPYKDWHAKAWTTALVLVALVLGLNIIARAITAWQLKRMGWR